MPDSFATDRGAGRARDTSPPPEAWALLAESSARLAGVDSLDDLVVELSCGLERLADVDRGVLVVCEEGGYWLHEIPENTSRRGDADSSSGAWIARALASAKPRFAGAVPDELLEDVLPLVDARAFAALPLASASRAIGALLLVSRSPDAYRSHRRAPLALLALQLGAQIGRLRATAALAERKQELRRAHEELERRKRSEAALAAESSERDRLESELHQAQKMEAIGRLAGGIAHDFNNILTAINGYSEIVLKGLDPESKMATQVGEIRKAGNRAAALTRQMLAFGRRQALQPKALDLGALASEMATMLERSIGAGIDLTVTRPDDLWTVEADAGQIEQVLSNLVVNARDAIDGAGRIAIDLANVTLDDEQIRRHPVMAPGRYVLLTATDTGRGMDAATRERVFEPFYTTKDVGKGSGLGLATVYGIVKQSRGFVWVESEPGVGTTFEVYLPAVAKAVTVAGPASPVAAARGSGTILVAEDEPSLRVLIRETLEERGYTVIGAANGEEGIALFHDSADSVDVVLTDVVMPRLGGASFVAEARRLRPDVGVIFMSGYAEEIVRRDVLDESAAFLPKPFTPTQLVDAVARVRSRPS
jgi:signal transduction histidine kinase